MDILPPSQFMVHEESCSAMTSSRPRVGRRLRSLGKLARSRRELLFSLRPHHQVGSIKKNLLLSSTTSLEARDVTASATTIIKAPLSATPTPKHIGEKEEVSLDSSSFSLDLELHKFNHDDHSTSNTSALSETSCLTPSHQQHHHSLSSCMSLLDSWKYGDNGRLCRRLYHAIVEEEPFRDCYDSDNEDDDDDDDEWLEKEGIDTKKAFYTTRFDWLLWQRLESMDEMTPVRAQANLDAIVAFSKTSTGDKDFACREFVWTLTSKKALERRQNQLDMSFFLHQGNKTKSIAAGDDAILELAATLLFQETTLLCKFGFSVDSFGVCLLLAMLKAHANASKVGWISADRLQDAFLTFWNHP